MNCKDFTQKYLSDVLKILNSASRSSLMTTSDDEEMRTYLVSLREALVDCYTSVVHGVTLAQAH